MKPSLFDENFVIGSPCETADGSHVQTRFDPLDSQVISEPDWDHIDSTCFGHRPKESRQAAAEALMIAIKLIIANPRNHSFQRLSPLISIRVVALVWVVDPSIYGGVSLRELSRRFAISHKVLEWHAQRWSRLLSIQNRAQIRAKGWANIPEGVDVSLN